MRTGLGVCLAACLLALSPILPAGENLIVYTSMKESLIGSLRDGFLKKHPEVSMDYQSAGAGKLMAKIAAERESGKILADIIWTSEVPDFFKMRLDGLLEKYQPANFGQILNPFGADYDGSFTAARLGTLGIGYNTRFIKTPPKEWSDLFKPEYKGAFGIANPALSGTSYMSVALLAEKFGWEFFEKLGKNSARIGKGSGQVIDDTASGDLVASLAVDYITNDKISKGAPLGLAYPPEMLVVPSPIAIFKGTPNLSAAKKFVDFLVSGEAQVLIAGEGTLPVRSDVKIPDVIVMPPADEAIKRAIQIDYNKILTDKEIIIKKFTDILQGRK
ncbi:MAG: ABC transporter substrate-binding protein [Planctomycetota bacterium]|jgi:iron(III) transport system substrate-binding protein|nr:ABC transporter substrate-binding protein [Planctomycetota bacterium]